MTLSIGDNPTMNAQQMQGLTLAKAMQSLTKLNKRVAQLEKTNTLLNAKLDQLIITGSQLSKQITHLENAQTENMGELKASHLSFLQQLADTLNSKKASSLEPTLQSLTAALQTLSAQLKGQNKLAR